ncbi:nucleoside monophosphate kinase [Solirubrobacter sp. CPCC 204708]|uniref:Adenylate kinase n=1 Tax=Solirubrobacter deserti TaxID=2282478 RepID=A0ABT4RV18_9ACTN|nr:nucleoside monophosphate kinase [Solirubrobacter deserti]MBE2320674.1 nucleoside monophosphate kinase [Solirubrobacter deserti]MDA0142421.1 nucleoside monophosphate kinase [Solirubrobacter deserti]
MRVLMLAPPGGGKGTQGVRLAEHLGCEHISSGDLLRAAVAGDTPLGREVDGYLRAGKLAPDALVTEAIRPILATHEHYVLDGFPRRLAQAEGVDFDVVVFLDVPFDVVKRRLLDRGREDDTPEVIEQRLHEYTEDTLPLVDHYRDAGVLVRIDGDRPMDEIAADLRERL